MLHPLLHFASVPAAATTRFNGVREMAFTDQLAEAFVSHASEADDEAHVDQGIVGTQQYAVVACCGQHCQNVPGEIYKGCANARGIC